jgi:malonyl-CoA/methylmalonyl-CoA synthetase
MCLGAVMSAENLFSRFERRAAQDPSRVLLQTTEGGAVTYADMLSESARVARALTDLGLTPGDRVSVQVEKSVANLWLYLGALRAGLVFHPLNPAYALEEMRWFIGNAEPGILICDPTRLDEYRTLCEEFAVPHLHTLDAQGQGSFTALLASAGDAFQTVPRRGDDLAALLYSSGTTGRPKGIMLTHDNLAANVEVLVDYWGFDTTDVLLHALPIYHVHGLFVAIHCVLEAGASMCWLSHFDTATVLQCLPHSTVMMGVPTYYTRLLDQSAFDRETCANMRLFISGSAPLLEDTFRAFEARTGHRILERYGMSETGMNSSNPLDGERRPGTVGYPLPGTEIRVVGESGEPLQPGDIGEIEVRGANVFSGYWRMPEKTAEDIDSEGWFHTGDQGLIDDRGYLSIVGRSKDMVITGGLNVYPKEVERVLDACDGVHESAVFGVPHPDFGEAVVGAVVAEPGVTLDEAALRAALAASVAKFKVPKRLQQLDALPRNAMGKVQKKQLRETWPWPF